VAEYLAARGGEAPERLRPQPSARRGYPDPRHPRTGSRIPLAVAEKLARAPLEVQRQAVADPKRAHTIEGQVARAAREAKLGRKQLAAPSGRFGVLLIGPPWKFTARSDETGLGRSPESHYSTASVAEILKTVDVPAIAAEDAVCFMWGLPHMCAEALELMAG
jgi:hypothetical protein